MIEALDILSVTSLNEARNHVRNVVGDRYDLVTRRALELLESVDPQRKPEATRLDCVRGFIGELVQRQIPEAQLLVFMAAAADYIDDNR